MAKVKPSRRSITRVCEKCGYEVDVAVVYHVCIRPKVVERPADAPVQGRRHSYPKAEHGTRACYQNGCQRPECREEENVYKRAYRERRRAS